MQEMKIAVEPLGTEKNAVVVKVRGVIDTLTAPRLEHAIDDLLSKQVYDIVIDLQEAEYISSAGWGTLISNMREVRLNQGDIVLVGLNPNVHEVFKLLELGGILKACPTLDDACAQLQILCPERYERDGARPSA